MKNSDLEIHKKLYDFIGDDMADVIAVLDEKVSKVMIVGHNNAINYVSTRLGDRKDISVPTTGFVHLEFSESTWAEVAALYKNYWEDGKTR